jgi:large subunit ribosomal protein L18
MKRTYRNQLTTRQRKTIRIRKKISGIAERPRLVVFKSNKHISAQIIDDSNGSVLVSASSFSKELRSGLTGKNKTDYSIEVGKAIAKKALEKSIETVVFDRNGYLYHGRVKALADASREAGLKF